MNTVFNIGYEASDLGDFLATLLASEVETLIDVRELPLSRRKGFSKNQLREALTEVGIEYIHLSGLGDPKPGRVAAKEGRFSDFVQIFKKHMNTEKFKDDFESAAEIVRNSRVCLMCYERDHLSCHRKIVGDALEGILGVEQRPLGVRKGLGRGEGNSSKRTDAGISQSVSECYAR